MTRHRITREQILNTAEKYFATKKFHEVLMADIANELKIAKGSLYNYFPSKEELYIQIIFSRFEHFLEVLKQKLESDCKPVENLRILVQQYYSFMCKYSHFFEIWKQINTNAYGINDQRFETFNREIRSLFHKTLDKGTRDRIFRIDSLPFTIDIIFGMLDKAIERGIYLERSERIRERDVLCNYILKMILFERTTLKEPGQFARIAGESNQ